MMRKERRLLHTWAIPIALVILWEVLTQLEVLDTRFFIPLSDIAITIVHQFQDGRLPGDLLTTILRLLAAFAFAAVTGVIVGLASGLWRAAEMLVRPVTDTVYPLPKIALLPLLIIIVGRGEAAYALTAFATAFFQITISTRAAVRNVDPQLLEAGRNFGATGWRFYTRLLFPAVAPPLFNGLRLGMATCLITLVVVEYVGAGEGLGAMIYRAGQQFAVDQIYAGIFITGFLGHLINVTFRFIEPRLLPWQADSAEATERIAAGA